MLQQIASILGAVMILVAFALNQIGLWRPDNIAYQGSNLLGSALLAFIAALDRQAGFLLLEGTWAVISLIALVRVTSGTGKRNVRP